MVTSLVTVSSFTGPRTNRIERKKRMKGFNPLPKTKKIFLGPHKAREPKRPYCSPRFCVRHVPPIPSI